MLLMSVGLLKRSAALVDNTCALCVFQELTAERAYEILRRISDEDCQVMGFNPKFAHPAWMVLTVLPVPPPAVRPSVQMDSSSR